MPKTLIAVVLLTVFGISHAVQPAPNAAAPDKIARGLLLQHQERLIFSPCRDRSYTSVNDASPGSEITTALREFGLGTNRPLYVEVFGMVESGTLRINDLNMASRDARCYAPRRSSGEWRAGDGTTWSLTLFEGAATLRRKDLPDLTGSYEETMSTPSQSEIRIAGTTATAVRITRQRCRDTVGDDERLFAWQATIITAAEKLEGCAWRQ